ncbi:helix-turn-helix domain-containing protein [Streptomyces arenae]|nr:helix-turn-helix domain-containing protein [Streptomyces arenae]
MTQSPPVPLPSPKERRRLREAKSLSQADLAAKVGVTRETVRSWETGRTSPRGRKREAYAKLLNAIAAEKTAEEPVPAVAGGRATGRVGSPLLERSRELGDGWAAPEDGGRTRTRPEAPEKRAAKPQSPAPVAAGAGTVRSGHPRPKRRQQPQATREARPEPPAQEDAAPLTPAQAFDALCARTAPTLVRQTYLLTGRRALAQESVERAFQTAWQRWPEVAVDRDPAGWVRAAAYEYAMSPWHRFRPSQRHPDAPPAEPADRAFLDVLLDLPPAQRRTLLLYDGVGLDLPETAAETEASTPAAANRLLHAREAIAAKLPDLSTPEALHRRLGEVGGAEKLRTPRADCVRTGSEHRARFWTRAAIAFTTLIIGATVLTLKTAPTHYEPPQSPGKAISGVPPRMGPGPLSYEDEELRAKLRTQFPNGPERLTPQPE